MMNSIGCVSQEILETKVSSGASDHSRSPLGSGITNTYIEYLSNMIFEKIADFVSYLRSICKSLKEMARSVKDISILKTPFQVSILSNNICNQNVYNYQINIYLCSPLKA